MIANELFGSTDEFIKYANVKKSMPFDKIEAFVDHAVAHVRRLIGDTALNYAVDDMELCEVLRHAVAPIAVSVASDELSINFGDAGHTVTKNDREAPAGDVKISAYSRSAYVRGMDSVDELLRMMADIESVREAQDFPLRHAGIVSDYMTMNKWMPGGDMRSALFFSVLRRYLQDAEYDYVVPVVTLLRYQNLLNGEWPLEMTTVHRLMEKLIVDAALLRWTEESTGSDPYFARFVVPLQSYTAIVDRDKNAFEREWCNLSQPNDDDQTLNMMML